MVQGCGVESNWMVKTLRKFKGRLLYSKFNTRKPNRNPHPMLRLLLLSLLLTSCSHRFPEPDFSRSSPEVPDTINKYIYHRCLGYLGEGQPKDNASRMAICAGLQIYETHKNGRNDNLRYIWRPAADGRAIHDTLWIESDVNSDIIECYTTAPRPDFSKRSPSKVDTLRYMHCHARFGLDCVNHTLQERGEQLWYLLNWISHGLFTTEPDSLVWYPSEDVTDDDSLWVFRGKLAFLASAPRHPIGRSQQTSQTEFNQKFKDIVACDTVASSFSLHKYFFFQKSGNLRPRAYSWLGASLAVLFTIVGFTEFALKRRCRKNREKGGSREASPITIDCRLHDLPAVRTLRSLANEGRTAAPADWYALEDAIHATIPEFTEKLCARCLFTPSEKEWRICLLVKVHFAPSEMATLLPCSKQSISITRTRLYEKITGTKGNTSDFDQFINQL